MTRTLESMPRRSCRALPVAALLIGGLCGVPAQAAPPAPVVTLAAQPKQINISWPVVSGASHYVVLESAGAAAPFVAISARIPQAKPGATVRYTRTISVHRHDWLNARYSVQACDVMDIPMCSRSIDHGVSTLELDAIGTLRAGKAAGAEDAFGYAVATSSDGRTVAIGAPYEDCSCAGIDPQARDEAATDAGAVYVFVKGSSGWTQQAYIKSAAVAPGDGFGMTVALSGDGNTLAVGAPPKRVPDGLGFYTGEVHVFGRAGDTWRQAAVLTASNRDLGDLFGSALVLSADGRELAVAAVGESSSGFGTQTAGLDNDEPASGAVYLFSRASTGSSWSQTAFIKGSHSDRGDLFGASLALSSDGSVLAVGSERDDSDETGEHAPALSCAPYTPGHFCDVGAVDVYERNSAGLWSHASYLRPAVFDTNDLFGSSVALSGDGLRLAVGAVGEDSAATGVNGDATDDAAPESGAAYLFTRFKGAWVEEAFIKPSDVDSGDYFGSTLAFDDRGDTLAVSARFEDGSAAGVSGLADEALPGAGAAFLFERSPANGEFVQTRYVKAPNPGADDRFGGALLRGAIALSGDGDTLVVPAADEDGTNDATPDSGAVYLY